MNYRPEIDGLRAVAVISVVLFHSGITAFSGGFSGVDVFFTISGFLICGMIYSDVKVGAFSIASFYERRIKRIIPALTVVVAATLAAGFVLFLPGQLVELGKATVATALFGSNIWFWTQAGYFAGTAELMPLLHTWSLAVEEQFYIIFPLLVAILARRPRLLAPAIFVLALGSLALSIYGTSVSPGASFYLLPTRAWELLAGSLLAVIPVPEVRSLKETASIMGIGLIGIGIFSFDGNTAFPGAAALVPVGGAILCIYGGSETLGGRALASKPLVWIGLISYSLYLWHWPILVFARQVTVSANLSQNVKWFCIFATLILSIASWRFVELPFRHWKVRRGTLFFRTGALLAAGISCGMSIVIAGGFSLRFNERALNFASAKFSPRGEECLAKARNALSFCLIGSDSPSFIFWGDSHAGALLPAVERVAMTRNRSGIFAGFNACPPLFKIPTSLPGIDHANCLKRNVAVVEKITSDAGINTVIITAFWSRYEFNDIDLQKMIDSMRGKRLIILEDVPTPGFNVPLSLALREGSNIVLPPITPSKDLSRFRVALEYRNVAVISLASALCADNHCPPEANGHTLYADDNHLSDYAAREIIGPYLVKELSFF